MNNVNAYQATALLHAQGARTGKNLRIFVIRGPADIGAASMHHLDHPRLGKKLPRGIDRDRGDLVLPAQLRAGWKTVILLPHPLADLSFQRIGDLPVAGGKTPTHDFLS